MKMHLIVLGFVLSLVLISGCSKESDQVIGGDKDEHGCLIAAGYSWCEAKQKCLRTWEEECGSTGTGARHVCTAEEKAAEVCTQEYAPVCSDDGITYGNGCMACSDSLVEYYTQGKCP
jgi:hypothetical protein